MPSHQQTPEINRAGKRWNAYPTLDPSTSQKGRLAMAIIRKQYTRRKCDPVEVERIWAERGGVKRCTKCGHTKRREQFKPRPKEKDGAAYECKDCRNKHERTKRAPLVKYSAPRKKVTPADYGETTWRPLEVTNAHDAWQWWLDNAPEWWTQARERHRREMQLGWWLTTTHRRRAKEHGAPIGDIDGRGLTSLMVKATHCHWCGEPLTRDIYEGVTKWTDATYDHVVPLSQGGAHSIENIVIAHAGCNYSRDGRDDRVMRLLGGEVCA